MSNSCCHSCSRVTHFNEFCFGFQKLGGSACSSCGDGCSVYLQQGMSVALGCCTREAALFLPEHVDVLGLRAVASTRKIMKTTRRGTEVEHCRTLWKDNRSNMLMQAALYALT